MAQVSLRERGFHLGESIPPCRSHAASLGTRRAGLARMSMIRFTAGKETVLNHFAPNPRFFLAIVQFRWKTSCPKVVGRGCSGLRLPRHCCRFPAAGGPWSRQLAWVWVPPRSLLLHLGAVRNGRGKEKIEIGLQERKTNMEEGRAFPN